MDSPTKKVKEAEEALRAAQARLDQLTKDRSMMRASVAKLTKILCDLVRELEDPQDKLPLFAAQTTEPPPRRKHRKKQAARAPQGTT